MFRIFFIFLICFNFLYPEIYKEGDIIKQKAELKKLKKELDEFYKLKEKEYQKQKAELQKLLKDIKEERKKIQNLKKDIEKLYAEIKGEITSKTIKIYNKAKPKIVAKIFTQMIKEGKIDKVFDIIIKMKNKNVTSLLKFLDPKDASKITQMLEEYDPKKVKNKF